MTRSQNRSAGARGNPRRVKLQTVKKVHQLSRKQKLDAANDQPWNDLVPSLSAVGPTPDF
jgi:hypothetical protein